MEIQPCSSSANGTRKNASNRELRLDVNTEVDVNGEDNEITRIKCTRGAAAIRRKD